MGKYTLELLLFHRIAKSEYYGHSSTPAATLQLNYAPVIRIISAQMRLVPVRMSVFLFPLIFVPKCLHACLMGVVITLVTFDHAAKHACQSIR